MRPTFLQRIEQRARGVAHDVVLGAFALALACAGAALLLTSPGIAP